MRGPLLLRANAKFSPAGKLISVAAIFLSCFLIWLWDQITSTQQLREVSEESVGSFDENLAIIAKIYLSVGQLADGMEHGQHYRNMFTVNLEPFANHCDESTPFCTDICEVRLHSTEPIAESPLHSTEKLPESETCRNVNSGGDREKMECWDTATMSCWNEGSEFFDGGQNWKVERHDKSSMDVSFLHLKKSTPPYSHLFIFGSGEFQSHNIICAKLASSGQALKSIREVPETEAVIFGGHSSGSAWAMCANFFLHKLRPNHSRRLIASGSMMASGNFLRMYNEVKPWDTDLYLLNSAIFSLPPHMLLPDLMSIHRSSSGITMPQFGFTCTVHYTQPLVQCTSLQPKIDLAHAMAVLKTLEQPSSNTLRNHISTMILPEIHSIYAYQKCFNACWDYFKSRDWNLSPNVFHYSSHDPTNPDTATLHTLGTSWSSIASMSEVGFQIPQDLPLASGSGTSTGAGPSTENEAGQSLLLFRTSSDPSGDQDKVF